MTSKYPLVTSVAFSKVSMDSLSSLISILLGLVLFNCGNEIFLFFAIESRFTKELENFTEWSVFSSFNLLRVISLWSVASSLSESEFLWNLIMPYARTHYRIPHIHMYKYKLHWYITKKIKNNQGNTESKLNPKTECKWPPDKYTY